MSDSGEQKKNFEQKWETTSGSHKSNNVLRRDAYDAFQNAYTWAKTVALGMISLDKQCSSSMYDDFYIALGRCNDANILEEVLEWLKMNEAK